MAGNLNGTKSTEFQADLSTGARHLPVPVGIPFTPLPDGIVAASEEMREIVSVVRAIAPTEITVLLMGESGTGKEVLARLIHDLSRRARGPFITVNCGAIPEGLIESELFGHERGAFTGAHAQRKGFFEAADGGTIFLDEIGEMPINLQVKLLRVLETGSFNRVGSATTIRTDARVIAATNRELEVEVRAGTFRADLYYRLRAVMLRIPPLRNRREDIPFLIDVLLREFVERHKLREMPIIESEAIHALIEHEWRGNVRELRNAIEQLVVLSTVQHPNSIQPLITADDVRQITASGSNPWQEPTRSLPMAPGAQAFAQSLAHEQSERELIYRALIELRSDLREIKEQLHALSETRTQVLLGSAGVNNHDRMRSSGPEGEDGKTQPAIPTLEERERAALRETLAYYRGNRREAASALGISERTLYRKLKEQGLEDVNG